MSPTAPPRRSYNVTFLLVLHLALALPLAYFLNIWADEASTLYATERGFWIAFQTAAAEQKQAPLYFWFLSLWRYIDGSIFFARVFSIICSLAAIKLFADLASRLLSPRASFLLAAFFALHPFLLWASLEIRVYSLVILLSILLIRLFLTAFWDDASQEHGTFSYAKLGFLIAAIISLYTNYYLGFLIAGLFAALLAGRRWRQAASFAVLMVIAGLAFMPIVLDLRAEFLSKTGGFREERSVVDGLRALWSHFLTFVLPTEVLPTEDQSTISAVRLWLVRLGVVALAALVFIKRRLLTANTAMLATVVLTVAVWLLVAASLLGTSYLALRHASLLFAPILLLLGAIFVDLGRGARESTVKKMTLAGGLIVLVSFAYGLTALYPNMTKRGDWARVGEFIRQNEQPGQPIVVFTVFEALALPYYYSGVNTILPDERYFAYPPEATFGSPESLARETEFVISEIPPEAERIWLVVSDKCISTKACTPLQRYVEANYTIEIEKEFYLEKLYLLKRRTL